MSSKMEHININKYIDVLPMIGNWEISTCIVCFMPVIFSALFVEKITYQLLSLVAGFLLAKLHIAMKRKLVRGTLFHLAYKFGLRQPKKNIPAELRYFVGA